MAKGSLIPMRELRALAKEAGLKVTERMFGWRGDREAEVSMQDDVLDDDQHGIYIAGRLCFYGRATTQHAARVQARANAKKFLECVLTMEYGEGE